MGRFGGRKGKGETMYFYYSFKESEKKNKNVNAMKEQCVENGSKALDCFTNKCFLSCTENLNRYDMDPYE